MSETTAWAKTLEAHPGVQVQIARSSELLGYVVLQVGDGEQLRLTADEAFRISDELSHFAEECE